MAARFLLNSSEEFEDYLQLFNEEIVSATPDTGTLVSNWTAFWFEVLVYVFLSGCVSIFGILSNVINIVVFLRQGIFSENGSASLLGLAVSDLCCVASMLWLSVSHSVVLADPPNLSWNPWDIMYLTAAWPHLMFAQTTRMVTAYVSFERCVCVVFPFKVKKIFTPSRSIIVIICIFACFALSYSPLFITQQLKYVFNSDTNSSRLVLVSAPYWQLVVDIMLYVNSFIFNIGAVVIVIICTTITVSRVKLSKDWRESVTSGTSVKPEAPHDQETEPKQMSNSKMKKEKRLIRMITSISLIFLICYVPDFAYLIMFRVDPRIRIGQQYQNLTMVMYSFTFLMESFSSSINIVVYYRMSSRYKQDFRQMFGLRN